MRANHYLRNKTNPVRILFAIVFCSVYVNCAFAQTPTTYQTTVQLTYQPFSVDSLVPEANYGYTLLPVSIPDPLGFELLRLIKKGRLKIYTDPACKYRLRRFYFRRDYPYLANLNQNWYERQPDSLKYPNSYEFNLKQHETWELQASGELGRTINSRMLSVTSSQGNAEQVFYLKAGAHHPVMDQWPLFRDFPASDETSIRTLLDSNATNPFLVSSIPDISSSSIRAVEAELTKLSERKLRGLDLPNASKSDIWLGIPIQLSISNHWNKHNQKAQEGMRENQALFQQVIPRLWRDILADKLPIYYKYAIGKERVPVEELREFIRRHPNTILDPTADNNERFDFSYGILELSVSGTFQRSTGTKGAWFKPVNLMFNWWDPVHQTLIGLGVLQLSDVEALRYRINGLPLNEFLAQQKYYGYLQQAGNYFPETIPQSTLVYQYIAAGRWGELPTRRKLKLMTDGEIEELLEQLNR